MYKIDDIKISNIIYSILQENNRPMTPYEIYDSILNDEQIDFADLSIEGLIEICDSLREKGFIKITDDEQYYYPHQAINPITHSDIYPNFSPGTDINPNLKYDSNSVDPNLNTSDTSEMNSINSSNTDESLKIDTKSLERIRKTLVAESKRDSEIIVDIINFWGDKLINLKNSIKEFTRLIDPNEINKYNEYHHMIVSLNNEIKEVSEMILSEQCVMNEVVLSDKLDLLTNLNNKKNDLIKTYEGHDITKFIIIRKLLQFEEIVENRISYMNKTHSEIVNNLHIINTL